MSMSNYSNTWFDEYSTGVVAAPGHNVITASNASATIASRISPEMLSRMNIDEMNHLMKGEMVSASVVYDEMQRENMISAITADGFKERVKAELCQLLVKEMMKNNLIEFTMSTDPGHYDYIYRARAYVMPDHMTKILREYVQRNT
jgi:hypothetical protein